MAQDSTRFTNNKSSFKNILNSFCCCRRNDYEGLVEEETSRAPSLCESENPFNLVAFFIFGLINNFPYVVYLSAAEKVLPKDYPTGIVLLVEMLPIMLAQGLAPLFLDRIPYWIRVIVISISASGSFLLTSFDVIPLEVKLTGIGIASMSSGFGEITFMGLSSGYHKNTVSLYSSGTGGAGIFGSLTFLLLSSVAGLSSPIVLWIVAPVPLLIIVAYFFILRPSQKGFVSNNSNSCCGPTSINSDERPMIQPGTQKFILPLRQKLWLQIRLLRYSGPLFVVYFSEYVINQGIAPVLTFPEDHMFHNDEYTYYQFLYQVGVFISRSSVNIFPIRCIWVLALWQVANMIILGTAAYFGYIPSIWIVFVIIVYEGLLGGAVYANAFYLVAEEIEENLKEFCMSSISFWYSIGILLSSVASIFVFPWLKDAYAKHLPPEPAPSPHLEPSPGPHHPEPAPGPHHPEPAPGPHPEPHPTSHASSFNLKKRSKLSKFIL